MSDIEDSDRTVTLQLSPKAFRKASVPGKDYTGILSRMLENALMDNELIRKSM
ncbi:MAG: hypothetical protein NC078_10845 [Ruminococcus sp.]|nr:hypothetical protein [Ruminococcus sp.]